MQKELPKNDEMDDEELQDLVRNLYVSEIQDSYTADVFTACKCEG